MTIENAKFRFVIVLFLALLYQSSSSPALAIKLASLGASDSGYELIQFDTETDKTIVQLSRLGLKVTNMKGGTVVVCTPPKWDVVAFSTRAKRICRTDVRHFTGEYRLFYTIFQKPGFSDIPLLGKTTSSTARGLPVQCFHSNDAYKWKQIKSFLAGEVNGNFPAEVAYCTCRKLPSTPQMDFVLKRMYGMPDVPGVPISLTYKRADQKNDSELETLKVSPKRYTADDFKIPSGLQPVENMAALRADQGSVERAAGLIDSVSKIKLR